MEKDLQAAYHEKNTYPSQSHRKKGTKMIKLNRDEKLSFFSLMLSIIAFAISVAALMLEVSK